jgi:hypothetical protein
MKLLLLLAVLLGPTIAHADTWVTDDDFTPATSTVASAVKTDGQYIYVVGGDGTHAYVRRRSIATAGWTTVDTYTGDGTAGHSAIAIDDQFGLIYVVGSTGPNVPNAQTSRWYVRRSKDHGQNWDTIHIGSYYANGKNSATDVRVTASHYIVVSLLAYDSNDIGYWIIKTDANNWGAALDIVSPAGVPQGTNAVASPSKMTFDSNGALVVTGTVFDTNGLHWITRRSGATGFSTIDDTTNRYGYNVTQINGSILITGMNVAGTKWITRMGTGAGGFTDVDVYQSTMVTMGSSLRELPANNIIYASGTDTNAWGIRKSTDGGQTWDYSDRYYLNIHHQGGAANDLWAAGGTMWAVGSIYDGTTSHWIVRYLVP